MTIPLRHPAKTSVKNNNQGFALIATISVMVLLVMVALSILSLSTIELRSSRASVAQAHAEANARMALMVALSELQKAVGPDQRITAQAGILDSDSRSLDVDGVANVQWTGIWRSFDTWLTATDSEGKNIQQTYTPGRDSHFMRWLVSHKDPDILKDLDAAKAALNESDSVILVDGAARSTSERDVATYSAGLIDMEKSNGSSHPKGRFAWGVIDENVKARINDYDTDLVADNNQGASDQQMRLNNVSRSGMEWLAGLENSPEVPTDWADLGKVITLPTGSQLESGDTSYRNAVRSYFYDLTTHSVSLPVNVRNGGLKKDLNMLLERSQLPTEYGRFSRSFPNKNEIVPIRAYTPDVPGGSGLNLSSWYKLHQFYRMAHADSVEESPSDMPQMASKKGIHWSGSTPGMDFFWHSGNMDEFGTGRGPVVSRAMLIFSTWGNASALYISVKPVIGLWNPYNVPLKISPQRLIFRDLAIQYKAVSGSTNSGWKTYNISRIPGANPGFWMGNGWFSTRISESGSPNDQNPIILQPGENRLFSPTTAAQNSELHATSDYDSSFAGHSFNVWPHIASSFPGKSPTSVEMAFQLRPLSNGSGFGQYYWFLANGNTGIDQRHNEFTATITRPGRRIPLIEDAPGKRIRISNTPTIAAAFQFLLKSGEDLRNPSPIDQTDYRCRSWIAASPSNRRAQGGQAVDKILGMNQHYFQVISGSGNTVHPDFEEDSGRNVLLSYMGTKVNAAAAAPSHAPQTHCISNEYPSAPISSLASLMHFPTNPGYTDVNSGHHLWDISANAALCIGNSFAHPMIEASKVYHFHNEASPSGSNNPESLSIRDFHDHVFLNNDALWDTWFCSTITAQQNGPFSEKRSLQNVFTDFMEGTRTLPATRIKFYNPSQTSTETSSELLSAGQPTENAHKEIAKYLTIHGGFNVNSTSQAAWKALFTGLKGRSVAWLDPQGGGVKVKGFPDQLPISRFSLANSIEEGSDAGDPASWKGIRLLTEQQIDRLAEECVRQVKLRGPFLNMADFINRRLGSDSELARVGALQAAIDWDEFNGNSPGSSSQESINGRYKSSQDMVQSNDWGLPFSEANKGSLYTGIPGYVTQADLLKGIGNQLTPRSDTFRIRAYGDSVDPRTGKVLARAWCEAIVVRCTEYVDAINSPDTETADFNGDPIDSLTETNKKFGRKFKIISFRWLSNEEI